MIWNDGESDRQARDRDRPLVFRAFPDPTWIAALQLPERDEATEYVRAAMIGSAYETGRHDPAKWISYSRAHDFYATRRRYIGEHPSRRSVVAAVKDLEAAGLIEHDRARPGLTGKQSRFRATPALMIRPAPHIRYERARTLLIMKDDGGRMIDYADSAQSLPMARSVAAINEGIARARIELIPGRHIEQISPEAFAVANPKRPGRAPSIVNTTARDLYRVFNDGTFWHGGRFYGGFWQGIPKAVRRQYRHGTKEPIPNESLLIDGEPTIELDFATLHPRLLYAQIGADSDETAYQLDYEPRGGRDAIKAAFNIAVNANTTRKAQYATARTILKITTGADDPEITPAALGEARKLIAAIRARHPELDRRGVFLTGEGVRLQRIDSDLCARVLSDLLAQGIVALPIHDSFLVRARDRYALATAMAVNLTRTLDALRAKALSAGRPFRAIA